MERLQRKKMSDHLNKSVEGILKLYGTDKMMQLYEDFYRIFEMWSTAPHEEAEMQELCDSNLDQLRLIRSAYALSMLAQHHYRDLRRIVDRYPNFYIVCENIAKGNKQCDL